MEREFQHRRVQRKHQRQESKEKYQRRNAP
jgi:hypothetical protein